MMFGEEKAEELKKRINGRRDKNQQWSGCKLRLDEERRIA